VVIGGLIREEQTRSIREVPLLSKLPLVGELFKQRSTSRRKSDILIFLTPHIIKDKP
jgi:type II secretory pathway component GspD/PulD (secretin)